MASLAIEPGVVELIETLTTSGGVEIDIEEVVVAPTSLLVGKTLAEAQTTLRSGAMIVALKEPRGLILNQRSEARIQAGDMLIIVGTPDQLAAFEHHTTAHPSS